MKALTPRQDQVLRLYARHRNWKLVARDMGVTRSTAHNLSRNAYERLGVQSAVEAFVVLGWLRVPEDER